MIKFAFFKNTINLLYMVLTLNSINGICQTQGEMLYGTSEKTWIISEMFYNGERYIDTESTCMYQTEMTFYKDEKLKIRNDYCLAKSKFLYILGFVA